LFRIASRSEVIFIKVNVDRRHTDRSIMLSGFEGFEPLLPKDSAST